MLNPATQEEELPHWGKTFSLLFAAIMLGAVALFAKTDGLEPDVFG